MRSSPLPQMDVLTSNLTNIFLSVPIENKMFKNKNILPCVIMTYLEIRDVVEERGYKHSIFATALVTALFLHLF